MQLLDALLSSDDPDHGAVIRESTDWCETSFLQTNITKSEAMVIDFRRSCTNQLPGVISDKNVKVTNQYRYLKTVIGDSLTFELHMDSCQRVFLDWWFNVNSTFMRMFPSSLLSLFLLLVLLELLAVRSRDILVVVHIF